MVKKEKIKFDKELVDSLIVANQHKRLILLHFYLETILASLHRKRFKSIDSYNWDDVCARVFYDVFVLCASDKWLKYSPQQIKRFLYVLCTNCALQEIKRYNKGNTIQINESIIPDNRNSISIFDVIEERGQKIEKQLIRVYEKLLGKRIVNEEYKILLKRCSRIIARKIITEESEYKIIDHMYCETDVVMSCASGFS